MVLDKELHDKLPAKLEEEDDMLDLAMGLTPTSRLSCQLEVSSIFEGAEIVIPERNKHYILSRGSAKGARATIYSLPYSHYQ